MNKLFLDIFKAHGIEPELPSKASCHCTDESYCEAHAEDAAAMRKREKDAILEDLLERCWFNLNGWEYLESRSSQSGKMLQGEKP